MDAGALGWKLDRIADASLLAFFDTRGGASPLAAGHLTDDWQFDRDVRELYVEFGTDIAGVSLRCRLYAHTLRNAGVRTLSAGEPVASHSPNTRRKMAPSRTGGAAAGPRRSCQEKYYFRRRTRLAFRAENDFGELVNWLEILDDRAGLGVTTLSQKKLLDIEEGSLAPGARIVCDLSKGKNGWYASRIHRVAD